MEIVKKTLINNSQKHVLWAINDVSTTYDAIWAGEEKGQKVKKKGKK